MFWQAEEKKEKKEKKKKKEFEAQLSSTPLPVCTSALSPISVRFCKTFSRRESSESQVIIILGLG